MATTDRYFNMTENNSSPNFNSALGAVILVDKLHSHASGYVVDLASNDSEIMLAYYNTLEALWMELEYWASVKELDEVDSIESIRSSLDKNPYQYRKLKKYHLLINRVSNKAGLRLQKTVDPENSSSLNMDQMINKIMEDMDL